MEKDYKDPHKFKEREFEIGRDEAWSCNMKRLFDEFLGDSLDRNRKNGVHFDKLISDAQQFDNARQVLANKALADTIDFAKSTQAQILAHAEIARDHQWNLDEQAQMATIVATVVASVLSKLGFVQPQTD